MINKSKEVCSIYENYKEVMEEEYKNSPPKILE